MGPVVEGGKNEKPQNPHLSGQGMLILLAPLSSWCSYANFRSPDGIDNFIYLTFRLDDFSKILFDDVPLNVQWGSSIRTIPGSQFGYIAEPVPPADHWIEGIDGARFAGYAYGNWDRLKDGYAFGYPIGINYSTPCNDSVYITDNMVCGIVNGKAVAVDLQQDTLCAALFNVIFRGSKSQNYSFALDPKFRSGDLEASFTLTPVDPGLPCVGVVEAMTRSGKTLSKTYTYTPEQVAATPSTLDFGLLKVNESKTLQFDVVNPGTVPTVIKSIRLKDNKAEFTMTPDGTVTFPFTLAPGAKQTFYVTALSNVELKQTVYDYVIVGLTCYEREIDTLKLTAGEPVVWIDDAYWDPIPVNTEKPKDVLIENRSDIEVILETITWNDKLHFPRVTNLDLPLTIPPRGTHTFTAYYFADVSGVVHSETAFFTSNADKEKLYSYWEGSGIDAGPVIEGYDWLKRRVIDQWAIDHGTTRYQGTVVINNSGNTPLDYIDLVIKNDPDNVFTLDKGSIPASLQPNTPITVTAWFAPKDEKYYESTVELVTKFAGETKTATATLKGTGIQPHIKVNDLDFVQPIIVGTSKDSMTKVFHITNKEPMELTITGFNIQGADQNAFATLPAWLSNNPTPFKIPIGNVIDVPIKFTAMHSGRHDANLIVSSDAPPTDDNIGALIGRGYTEGLLPTDHDFLTIFITTTKDGVVSLKNEGSETITVNGPLQITGDDSNYFTILNYYTINGGNRLDNPDPIVLDANGMLYVDVRFAPLQVRQYNAKIDYETTSGSATSNLVGRGKLQKMIARIPAGKYIKNPGEQITPFEFLIENPSDETKPLSEANITSFLARVYFKPDGTNPEYYDVYPNILDCAQIVKQGTMTQNWTCEYARIVNGKYLEVKMNSTQPLSPNSGTLFTFTMNTFLSETAFIPVPCGFEVLGIPKGYVVIDTLPGDIRINPVCVDTLRMIKPSDVGYSISQNNPNPVENKTTIQYSVGIDANVTISLYDSKSNKIGNFVDEFQHRGVYEIVIDVNKLNLSSGVYFYKIETGPYTETKTMVITR